MHHTHHTKQSIEPHTLRQIASIERMYFDDAWQEIDLLALLGQFGAAVLVVHDDTGSVVGYCLYSVVFDVAEILRIASAEHRQGIGGMLMNELVEHCQNKGAERLLLEVRADNKTAIAFYKKWGFLQIDVRKGYYGRGMDARIFEKIIHV